MEEVSLHVRTRSIAIRLSLRLKRKTSGLFCMSTVAFLHALSTALIDAIPLKCSLCRETSSGLGSARVGTTGDWYDALFASLTQIRLAGCKWDASGDGSCLHTSWDESLGASSRHAIPTALAIAPSA